MRDLSFAGVINPGASTLKSVEIDALKARIAEALAAQGHRIDFSDQDKDAAKALREAAADRTTDGLLAAGGDGTVSLAAGLAVRHGKALAVVPGGNMNLFARSLGLPVDPFAAAEALSGCDVRKVDIAYANDRPFIHEFSLGLHPELIADRDRVKYGSRLGKLVGTARAALRLIARPPRVRLWLDQDGVERPVAMAALFVSNNRLGPGHLPFADRLDEGVLGVYAIRSRGSAHVARLAAAIQTGSWQELPFVSETTATALKLTRRGTIRAAIDGELVKMRSPVDIRIDPGALEVLAPEVPPGVTQTG